ASVWLGDLDAAVEAARRCVDEYGHWQEVREVTQLCWSKAVVESTRGRTKHAWQWMIRARRFHDEPGVRLRDPVVAFAARACWVALGRNEEPAFSTPAASEAFDGNQRYQATLAIERVERLRVYTESGDLGGEF